RIERIGARQNFGAVARTAAVGIGVSRISPDVELSEVGEPVAVGVLCRIGRIERIEGVRDFVAVRHSVAVGVRVYRARPDRDVVAKGQAVGGLDGGRDAVVVVVGIGNVGDAVAVGVDEHRQIAAGLGGIGDAVAVLVGQLYRRRRRLHAGQTGIVGLHHEVLV